MRASTSSGLTRGGRVFGASAPPGGRNVEARLSALGSLHPIAGKQFADIGCGTGSYCARLARLCSKRLICVDILRGNVLQARSAVGSDLPGVEYCVSAAESLPLAGNTFDAAFYIEALDHVDDVAQVLREAYRILAPGGRCYVTVPNRLYPLETHPVRAFGRLWTPLVFPFLPWLVRAHRRMATARVFRVAELKALAARAGFSETRVSYVMPPLETRGGPLAAPPHQRAS